MTNFTAIGDIHGMSGLLDALLKRIPPAGTLIFLGDYIDRGPATREVITRLLQLRDERECVFLRGNHEAMALSALQGNSAERDHWLRNGGLATLESYGGRISPEHEEFLRNTRAYYETEDYIFVHAGLAPGYMPDETPEELLYWIRAPFLESTYDWGKPVIHGHTPTPDGQPDVRPNRINIDTGAVYGRALTALLLPEREFISVRAEK